MSAAEQIVIESPAPVQRYCRGCGYPLRGLAENRCPECGEAFDFDDPRTYADSPQLRWRRWVRPAAKLALLLAVGYALLLSWLWWDWRQERDAFDTITANGSVIQIRIGPKWLARLVPRAQWLDRITVARLNADGFTDESMAPMSGLRRLEDLRLMNTSITEAGLEPFIGLPRLKTMTFQGDSLTAGSLERLERFKPLRVLILVESNVTAEQVRRFKETRPDVEVFVEGAGPR